MITLLLAAVAAALFGAGMAWLSHRLVHRDKVPDTGPAIGTAAGAVASFFIFTIAFMTVTATASLGAARQGTYAEAGAISDLYMATHDLAEPQRGELREELADYTRRIISDEWPALAAGHQDFPTREAAYQLALRVNAAAAQPQTPAHTAADLHDSMHGVMGHRRDRLAQAQEGLPYPLIFFLVGTSVLTILFLVLMGWPRGRRGTVAISVIGVLFAFGIWLVLQINHPYGGSVHVDPTAYQQALDRIDFLKQLG
ncbi:hypothetical protein ACGFX4_29160 [Kitasatospora sp. NPDC048365]|uniref:bestrophin-like domain n=1 Tax=Kitasatospora sp. NPDC048365 TaxID=3364050 RepID=UPI003713C832